MGRKKCFNKIFASRVVNWLTKVMTNINKKYLNDFLNQKKGL